tara:strand:- start:350 stop:937 length:588 start_codon:yes stop_codon:yes gene_type:complete
MTGVRDQRNLAGVMVSDSGSVPEGTSVDQAPAGDGSTVAMARDVDHELEERLSFIYALWKSKRNGKELPSRQDLDPAEFHRLWPVAFLLEWDAATSDWCVRFAGSAYGSVYGREITGSRINDIVPESLAPQVREDLRRCVDVREPIVIDGETTWPDRGNVYRYQRVLLPYGRDDGEVTHLLGVAAFYNSSGATVF